MSLVDDLVNKGVLQSPQIIKAFKKIKRKDFVLPEYKDDAEADIPFSINFKQTISQPTTIGFMFELLQPKQGDKILDIGSGSGWTTSLLAEIVGSRGTVFGIERISELARFARKNIDKYNFIKKGIAQIFCSDGYLGLPDLAPFDKILISAAAERIPENLLKQLKIKGRLIIPIGKENESQDIVVVDKIGKNNFKKVRYPGFIFVPLVKRL